MKIVKQYALSLGRLAISQLPRRYALALLFRKRVGYFPNFHNPSSFSEMLTFKLLRDDPFLLAPYVDKVQVRDIVGGLIGITHLVPLVGVAADVSEFLAMSLPEQVVVKASHGSGMVRVYTDTKSVDWRSEAKVFSQWLRTDYSRGKFELPYKYAGRNLLVEKLLVTPDGRLPADYKVYVFAGQARLVQVISGRGVDIQLTNFTPEGQVIAASKNFKRHTVVPAVDNFPTIISTAEALAGSHSFVRIDLYSVNNSVYFGEYTFYPGAGMTPFRPHGFDLELGAVWRENRPISQDWFA